MGKKNKLVMLCILLVVVLSMVAACGKEIEDDVEVGSEALNTAVMDEAVADDVAETETEDMSFDIIPESFAYSITVSINPLVELYFDVDDVVVGVAYLNEDAIAAYQELDVIGSDLETGMEMLIQAAVDDGYLKNDGNVEIELAKVGNEDKEFDELFSVNLNQVASQIIGSTEIQASVEVSVDSDVEAQTGVKALEVCSACNGTGNDCKECNGTAIVNCKRCVNGVESCGTCNGTAQITCHGCHGAKTEGTGENVAACSYCGGSGVMSCDACHGQGTFSCSWCKGELKHICPECWGEGVCSTCGGTGYM